MQQVVRLKAGLRADHVFALAFLLVIAVVSWLYLANQVTGAEDTARASGHEAMGHFLPWNARDVLMTLIMWSVMVPAMMVPAAAPMVLMYASVSRGRGSNAGRFLLLGAFVAAYLLVWTAFSAIATLAQWGLNAGALLSPESLRVGPFLGGALLLAAGAYQWSSLKYACLRQCRMPLGFVISEWKGGLSGALQMGSKHGAVCLGCCWLLMLLLFALGTMSLAWMGALAGFMLIEKVVPAGFWISRASGLLLAGAGIWMIGSTLIG